MLFENTIVDILPVEDNINDAELGMDWILTNKVPVGFKQ